MKVIDAWPPQDTLANIISQAKGNGGAPFNILLNLAKLDSRLPLEAIGLVGEDADGHRIVKDWRAHGINISQLRTTVLAPTSYTDVMTGLWCPTLNIPAESVVGVAGAGHAFNACMLLGLHEMWPIETCLALDARATAASVTEVTCPTGERSFSECLELANRWGYHEILA